LTLAGDAGRGREHERLPPLSRRFSGVEKGTHMRRLITGLVVSLVGIGMLSTALPARADGAGEVILEAPRLKLLKDSKKWGFRGTLGKTFIQRDFGGDDIRTLNINPGFVAYHGYGFIRGDVQFNVIDDEEDDIDISTDGWSVGGGYHIPLRDGQTVVAGWMSYNHFNTEFDGFGDEIDFGLSGPAIGVGVNHTFKNRSGKLSRLSGFVGGRVYFALDESSDLEDIDGDAGIGFEISAGTRYYFTKSAFFTSGITYRNIDLDTGLGGDGDLEDIVSFFNIGMQF
jgi:hypothetical protein